MSRFSTALLCAGVLALSACSETNFDTASMNKTETGALIGAGLGGFLGATRNDNKLEKTVIGAGLGAAVGGLIGNHLDKQAADLRRDIPNQDIAIENTGSELKVTMPQGLLFDIDSAELRPTLTADLQSVARNLQQYPDSIVSIVGHTDDTGSDSHNFDLSERRAQAVSWVLLDAGVDATRLQSYGQGETRPVASNATEAGRAQNRRVEIIIRPNTA